ncbi:GTP pyrophosphokinase family protein [Pseudomonas sp. KCJK9009]|uniref:GTP pyrophosphokinase n=1 Tax=Pseudomonas sp. KCJK9009 TaxID=3344561 RepID=UPI003906C907
MTVIAAPELIQQYRDLKPKLARLKHNLLTALEDMITQKHVPIFAIESRIKDEDSLLGKISRKGYEPVLDNIDDLCGIRVICYYQTDIDTICQIIDDEFDVLSKEDKQSELDDDKFGYRSFHYVVKIKDEWLAHPSARGLDGLKAEIQVRTMLMHTWSAISHKLLYKKVSDAPAQLRRKLNRLSALIELADEQFDSIKDMKIEYKNVASKSDEIFKQRTELNSDDLLALRDKYFSDRNYNDDHIPSLLEDIRKTGFTMKTLVENIEHTLPILESMEQEEAENSDSALPMWGFAGVIRTILDLNSDKFYYGRKQTLPDYVTDSREKYRCILNSAADKK